MWKKPARVVVDRVHRVMEVPHLCNQFLDTSFVQRMRHIGQLGLCSFVFPSATHTRFEHSLGVMHKTGQALEILMRRSPYQELATTREMELVKLGGLMHDVGHLGFSHLFDKYKQLYVPAAAQARTLADDPFAVQWDHEARSLQILSAANDALHRPLSRQELTFVGGVICGKRPSHVPETKECLFQLVHGEVWDTDRGDYLARDALAAGVPAYDDSYLMQQLNVCPVTHQLAFAAKTSLALEMMVVARQRMFAMVYHHPKALALEKFVLGIMPSPADLFAQDLLCDPEDVEGLETIDPSLLPSTTRPDSNLCVWTETEAQSQRLRRIVSSYLNVTDTWLWEYWKTHHPLEFGRIMNRAWNTAADQTNAAACQSGTSLLSRIQMETALRNVRLLPSNKQSSNRSLYLMFPVHQCAPINTHV